MRATRRQRRLPSLVVLLAVAGTGIARAENIDPANDGSQYLWGENVGWINAEPSGDGGPGMEVGDFELTGWLWAENGAWISLSCSNTSSCGTTDYRVRNDGAGTLSGFAFSENLGWINFAPVGGGGVDIDPSTGEFKGTAWSENAGWISFQSSGANPFTLVTSWNCDPPPPVPTATPSLTLSKSGNDLLLEWTSVTGATGSDLVVGNLGVLRSTSGDFSASTDDCLSDNDTDGQHLSIDALLDQTDQWYVLRPLNCGGAGSFDSGGAGQVGSRDAGIAGSGAACP